MKTRMLIAGALGLLVLGWAGLAAFAADEVAPASTEAPDSAAASMDAPDSGDGAEAAAQTAAGGYEEVPAGVTEAGHFYLGDPEAPVTLEEYSDYLCPFCARHFQQTFPVLREKYIAEGRLRYVFRDFPIPALHPTAAAGAAAARCVGEQDPVLFWDMHAALFSRQGEWNRLTDPAEFLAGVAEEVGADPEAYERCIEEGDVAEAVADSAQQAVALGFEGTPGFRFLRTGSDDAYTLVGAQPAAVFEQWADRMLAGEAPSQPAQVDPEKAELPFWASIEGLAPDPDRAGFTAAGDPYKGDPGARLTVVEFSDFQCPSCRRHALETQAALDKAFVDTGKVRWVVKHFPLRSHANAPAAAAAAECAADQGAFWAMQRLLFEKQAAWSESDPDEALPALADELELDRQAFAECFGSRAAMERVLADLYDALGLVRSTPTFVIVYGGRGAVYRGAKPPERFTDVLDSLYEDAGKTSTDVDAGTGAL